MKSSQIPLGVSHRAWNGEGSRRKLLCQLEQRCNSRQFFLALLDCPAFEIKGVLEERAFVAGPKAFPKEIAAHERVAEWALEVLHNPFVAAVVERNPLCIEDGVVRPMRFNPDEDSGQTIVVDAEHQLAYVFEAGMRYVRLVNSRSVRYEQFRAQKGVRVLKVWGSGLVTTKNIVEVARA